MTAWTNDELQRIGEADELELTAAGRTVTIRVVRVGDHLYVRSWRGRSGSWFRRAQQHSRDSISAGGVDKAVTTLELVPRAEDAA